MGWLKQPDVLVERIQFMLDWKLPQMKALRTSNSPRPPRRWPTGCWKCPLSLDRRRLQRQHAPQGAAGRRQDPAVPKPSWAPAVISSAASTLGHFLPVSGAYAGIGGGLPGLRPERVIAVAKAFSSSVGTGTC